MLGFFWPTSQTQAFFWLRFLQFCFRTNYFLFVSVFLLSTLFPCSRFSDKMRLYFHEIQQFKFVRPFSCLSNWSPIQCLCICFFVTNSFFPSSIGPIGCWCWSLRVCPQCGILPTRRELYFDFFLIFFLFGGLHFFLSFKMQLQTTCEKFELDSPWVVFLRMSCPVWIMSSFEIFLLAQTISKWKHPLIVSRVFSWNENLDRNRSSL